MRTWQVQDAKTRLSEVIERARSEGPQSITRHGKERAVVLSIEDYRSLVAQRPDFKSYLLGGPKVDDFSVERDPSSGRDDRPLIGTGGYLLDTNVISETRKSRADVGVIAFLSAANSAGLYLSVLTLGELRKGVAAKRRTDIVAGDQLGAWVDGIEANFADRLLSIDAANSKTMGRTLG